MTYFVKLEDGHPVGYAVTEDNLKALFPDHVFPKVFAPSDVLPLGFGIYEWTQVPVADKFKKIVEVTPTIRENGIYYQSWSSIDMDEEEKAKSTEEKAKQVRVQRDVLLLKSDWTQLADSYVDKTTWAAYRQQLRDVPSQSGFPWEVTWPTTP